MHGNNIPIANISEAVGHTIDVHLKKLRTVQTQRDGRPRGSGHRLTY